MKKVVVFIAMSVDGYIADNKGGVDWLEVESPEGKSDYDGYKEFIKAIDTVVIGNTTYQQIINELSPNQWLYQGLKSYVISHQKQYSKEDIEFVNREPKELINEIKKEEGKDIWICGGASIVQQLHQDKCIDEYYLTIIPTILGNGVSLFTKDMKADLLLQRSYQYNGMIELIYSVKK